ncbi:hypothetical protein D3C76_1447880 [compost metagenome]
MRIRGFCHKHILIISGKDGGISSRNSDQTIDHNDFVVDQVPNDFLNGPFVGSITVIPLLLGQFKQKLYDPVGI